MEPLGLDVKVLAEELGLPECRVQLILDGVDMIDHTLAEKLARRFNTSLKLWSGLQDDFEEEERTVSGMPEPNGGA